MVASNLKNTLSSTVSGDRPGTDSLLWEYLPVCVTLVALYQDEEAATMIHNLCRTRLTSFARSRIFSRLAQRVDAEDIVQDTFESFFRGLKKDRFQIDTSSELWNTLLAICVNKIRTQSQHHSRKKRSFHAEERHDDFGSGMGRVAKSVLAYETPVDFDSVIERLRSIVGHLDAKDHDILLDSLSGSSNEELARKHDCSERSIRRVLHQIKDRLQAEGRS
jgi:RNA polymerase sigma factor (sigma-70 family)